MNSRYINAILAVICLVLLGLIVVQVNWVKNSYLLHEQRFDQEVGLALSNTTHKLEINEAENYFRNAGMPNMGQTLSMIYDTVQTLKQYNDKFTLLDSTGQ